MKNTVNEIWRIVLITILGTLGSMVAGLMKYGGEVFVPSTTPFAYFLAYGFGSSCIFAFYHVKGLSNSISAAMVMGAILFVGISLLMPVLYSAIYSFGVMIAVVILAFLFERKLAYMKHWKFIVVGIIFGELYVLLTLAVLLLTKASGMSAGAFQQNFFDGMIMGLGLGLGIETAESVIHSVELHQQAKK